MEFDHDNVRRMVEEDRLSSLPDELIHKILSCFDIKFAVRTCVLSSRWEFLWTSMPCLNLSSDCFRTLNKFAKFVTHVLSHRDHQIEVASVNLDFFGAANEDFVSKIANYAFSHNVQQLTVTNRNLFRLINYPPCLFSSQSLKHFTLTVEKASSNWITASLNWITLNTPFDFPALTTMHLSYIRVCGDLFSKCVNLKNLTLEYFSVDVDLFDIIAPRLSNLILIRGYYVSDTNLIAPQLENLTIDYCWIKYLNAPPGLSSLRYRGDYHPPLQLSKNGFHSLNKVTMCLSVYSAPYKEEDAHNIISMLQELHTARDVTLSANIVECLSSFPYLLSHHPSPFSNLISLCIDYRLQHEGEGRIQSKNVY